MKKKILLLILLASGLYFLFRFKPMVDVVRVGFKEVPTVTPVTEKPVLKFAVIGDPESDLESLKKTLTVIKKNKDDFFVIAGDLTQIGSTKQLAEMKEFLDGGGIKYYVVPGNHDLYTSRKQTKDPKKYYREVFGTLHSQVIKKAGKLNINFLFLDNSEEYLGLEKEQMAFIKNSLQQRADLTLIFFHLPVYHPASDYIMGYQEEIVSKQKDELLNIFKESPVSAVFAGHLHHTSSYEWSEIKMYVAGSINSSRNWQLPRFLEVKIYDDKKISVEEIEL